MRPLCLSGFLACLLAAVGCSGGEGLSVVTRLGPPDLGSRRVARETRDVLPALPSQILPARLDAGCMVHVGHANLGGEGTLTFRVGLTQADGATLSDLYSGSSRAGEGWTDAKIEVSRPDVGGLILTVSGTSPESGIWSRPLVVCPATREREPPKNVLLVSLDTLRADRLGAYGNPNGLTPSLDRLAAEGTLFEHAYAQFPNTLGSHASLFTGQYPSQHRVGVDLLQMDGVGETLAQAFARRGYATAAFTEDAFVSSDFGFNIGFDSYHDGPQKKMGAGTAEETFGRGVDWLERRPNAPFFLFLHTYEVHVPYRPEPELLSAVMRNRGAEYRGGFASSCAGLVPLAYNQGRLALSAADKLQIERLYDAEVVALDRAVGRLVKHLERLGLAESTLLVLFSDHGESFYEHDLMGHGTSLYDEVMRVPVILYLPGVVPRERRITSRIGLIDLGPTIAELAGIGPILTRSPGRSRADWLLSSKADSGGPVFSELDSSPLDCDEEKPTPFTLCPYDGVAVRDEEYTYIQSRAHKEEFLYAFPADIAEQRDLAGERQEVVARYRKIVDEFRERMTSERRPLEPAEIDPTTQEKLRQLGYIE